MFITKSKIDWYLINTKSPIKEYPVSIPQKFTKITNWRVKLKTIPRCPNSTLIYLIKTSRYNFELRRLSRIILPKNKALFVIGLNSETGKLFVVKNQYLNSILENIIDEKKLKNELKIYDDFIVGDFVDSYKNLTLKTLTSYTYFADHCDSSTTKWIVMKDDDTLIDQFRLAKGCRLKENI